MRADTGHGQKNLARDIMSRRRDRAIFARFSRGQAPMPFRLYRESMMPRYAPQAGRAGLRHAKYRASRRAQI